MSPADEQAVPPLPEAVRSRVLQLAADRLAALPPEEVPAPLRAVARFTASRRARLGGGAIAAVLEADEKFRAAVVDGLREQAAELVAAVATGAVPPAAPAVEVAAIAYLLRSPGWQELLAASEARLADREAQERSTQAQRATARLQRELADSQRARQREVARARADLDAARSEVRDLRAELRQLRTVAAAAERRAAAAEGAAAEARRGAAAAEREAQTSLRRLRSQLSTAEAAAEASRRAMREGRALADDRLWLLVETLGRAVAGLREELALTRPDTRPADRVTEPAGGPADPFGGTPLGALGAEDPAALDGLLALPMAHLIVDGYNVTKTGFAQLTLEAQRARLVAGLGALAAQTGAEVTCVFDGGTRPLPVPPPAPRGVRVAFSGADEIADDVIRRLVAAEPPGRPVIVVTSDRAVVEDVRRAGAWPLSSLALVRRLERG